MSRRRPPRDPVAQASDAIDEIIERAVDDFAGFIRSEIHRVQREAFARAAAGEVNAAADQAAADERRRQRQAPPPEHTDDERDAVRAAAKVLGLEGRKLTPAIVKARRKLLARKHHPDRAGGNAETMKRINSAADFLLEELEDSK